MLFLIFTLAAGSVNARSENSQGNSTPGNLGGNSNANSHRNASVGDVKIGRAHV